MYQDYVIGRFCDYNIIYCFWWLLYEEKKRLKKDVTTVAGTYIRFIILKKVDILIKNI